MMNFEPHPTDPDKLVIKMQPYHIAKYTEEELQAAIKAENEACAKVCDEMDHDGVMVAADCAAAIRERMK